MSFQWVDAGKEWSERTRARLTRPISIIENWTILASPIPSAQMETPPFPSRQTVAAMVDLCRLPGESLACVNGISIPL